MGLTSHDAEMPGMTAAEVAAVIRCLEARQVTYQVNGGWAVDALVGRQTRPHGDLDVFCDETEVPHLLDWLSRRGYTITEDWRPVRVELTAGDSRVDVHPMRILPSGDGIQQGLGGENFTHPAASRTVGRIGDEQVVVADAARLRELRQGYEPRPEDLHDLRLLDAMQDGCA